jgi:hypothetical protein
MDKITKKRKQFHTFRSDLVNSSDFIFDYAFALIKEGIINMAINGTLDEDMNLLDLDTILNEPDYND